MVAIDTDSEDSMKSTTHRALVDAPEIGTRLRGIFGNPRVRASAQPLEPPARAFPNTPLIDPWDGLAAAFIIIGGHWG